MNAPALLLLLLAAAAAAARPLGPHSTKAAAGHRDQTTYYVFGYGSLLNRASAQKTNCQLSGIAEGTLAGLETLLSLSQRESSLLRALQDCAPRNERVVRVAGLRRGFFASADAFGPIPIHPWPDSAFLNGFSALGAVFEAGHTTTGLVYELDEAQYNRTLRREGGYALKQLPLADVTLLAGAPLPAGARVTVFAMPPESVRSPSPNAPICSSYVDVFLGGALELQARFGLAGEAYRGASPGGAYSSFVEETIRTTHAWSRYWVNDRSTPLRPFVEDPLAFAVDAALWQWAPHSALRGMHWPGQLGWGPEWEEAVVAGGGGGARQGGGAEGAALLGLLEAEVQ